jgi:hypothetical protein
MALWLTLGGYVRVILPLAGLGSILPSIWPKNPADPALEAPKVIETCAARTLSEGSPIRYGTTPVTATEHSLQYITIEQTLTVTEVSSYNEPAVTIQESVRVTEPVTTTIKVTVPTAASSAATEEPLKTDAKSKSRLGFLLLVMFISFAYGVIGTIWLGLWILPQLYASIHNEEDTTPPTEQPEFDSGPRSEPMWRRWPRRTTAMQPLWIVCKSSSTLLSNL